MISKCFLRIRILVFVFIIPTTLFSVFYQFLIILELNLLFTKNELDILDMHVVFFWFPKDKMSGNTVIYTGNS